MTPDEMQRAVYEAQCYLRGREFGGPGTPVADQICRALLAAQAELERIRPVYEAAVAARGVGYYHSDDEPGTPCLLCDLNCAIDSASAGKVSE